MTLEEGRRALGGRLLVSCQASDGDPFREPDLMARFAKAAVAGGASGIRANGPDDVAAIRSAVNVPVIGIQKQAVEDGRVLITPTLEAIDGLAQAGADMIALDCTKRGQQFGAALRIRAIKNRYEVLALADISTVEEAQAAEAAGADMILSTLRGYTAETSHVRTFEPSFIKALVQAIRIPVIAEGRIRSPAQARQAMQAGAFAVIVGTAITRPRDITRSFVDEIRGCFRGNADGTVLGIDVGGTNTKFGLVSATGELLWKGHSPTPAKGRDVLLNHLKDIAGEALSQAKQIGLAPVRTGIATAGWVDVRTGHVAYATDNLPGWTGTAVAAEVELATGVAVCVENDANALAVGEKHFGAAQTMDSFVCVTLGTGVGGACYVDGKLNRGSHYFANALGHISIHTEGKSCNCGQRGCLEAYASETALLSYSRRPFSSAQTLIAAANSGDSEARQAIKTLARHLARGCAILVQLLDPEAFILAGGLAQQNPILVESLTEELSVLVSVWKQRQIRIIQSQLGYYAGVLGAAAVAIESQNGCLSS